METMAMIGTVRAKQWLWAKMAHAMHLEYRLQSGIRVKISSFADWCIYNDVFVSGEYDSAIQAALCEAREAGSLIVADIGANVGFFTLRVFDLLSRSSIRIPHVECFLVEASPHLEQRIRDHVSQLQREGVEINLVIGLVGEKVGSASFEFRSSESGNRVVTEPRTGTSTLAYYDLDKLLTRVAKIDLFKCDIEGSEFEVLKNYPHLLKKANVAVFEFHEPRCPAELGIAKTMEAGFGSWRILYDQGYAKTVLFERCEATDAK
jgi:FkbM family methyltransferase